MNYEQARFNMIEQQIRPWEVVDNRVLSLLAMVKREDFLPAGQQALAFVDTEIALPPHTNPSQTMLAPKIEARVLQDLGLQKHETVLEIGAGSGYMAALLAHSAREVISLEIEPILVETARLNLQRAGIYNAQILHLDGSKIDDLGKLGVDSAFDAIVLSGSVAEIPASLLYLLKVGGRLSAIEGFDPMMRASLVTRVSEESWRTQKTWDTVAPRLLGFPEPPAFTF